jgi:hypothetical protein
MGRPKSLPAGRRDGAYGAPNGAGEVAIML